MFNSYVELPECHRQDIVDIGTLNQQRFSGMGGAEIRRYA